MSLIIVITNKGGTKEIADYGVMTYVNKKKIWEGEIIGHNRKEPWNLLLEKLLEQNFTNGSGAKSV